MVFESAGLCVLFLVLLGSVGPRELPKPDDSSEWENELDESDEDMSFFSETPIQKNDDIRQFPIAADLPSGVQSHIDAECGSNATDPECTGIVTSDHLWPKTGNRTVIAYHITTDFDDDQKTPIEVALQRIEHQTGNCITFKKIEAKKQPVEDHIKFETNQQMKCHTFVGRQKTNVIDLASVCVHGNKGVGIVMHEVLHKLGFFHEHNRPDRSDFVKIHRGNIDRNELRNFDKFPNMNTYEFNYDVESIMHYGPKDGVERNADGFAKNKTTITPRSQYKHASMGQRVNLSDGDIKKILLVYGCCARDELADCVAAIRANKTNQNDSPPFALGTTFSFRQMNASEWDRQQLAYKCRFPVNPAYTLNTSMPTALTINCNKNVTRNDLKDMVKGISNGPARPVAVFLHDSKKYMEKGVFELTAKNVVIFSLRDCNDDRATRRVRTLGFVKLLRFHLSNCADLKIEKEDFYRNRTNFRLDFLRMISFANTTIRSLEATAFEGLPRLVTVSLEYGASSMRAMSPSYATYLLRLHCSCGFSGFRRWMNSENMVKVHSKSVGEIYNIPHSWINSYVPTRRLHLNYDCAQRAIIPLPGGHYENLERFSLNDAKCIPDSSP